MQQVSRIEQGKSVYEEYCANCHGKKLEGQPNWKKRTNKGRLPAPPGHTWHHSDQLLFELTKFGMVPPNISKGYKSNMPAFKEMLSDTDIWAVLSFIKNQWPEEIQKYQQEMSAREAGFSRLKAQANGEQLYSQNCMICHTDDGSGVS